MKPVFVEDAAHLKKLTTKYCNDILSGKMITGKNIKNMIRRFQRHQKDKRLYVNYEKAYRCVDFMQCLKHNRGKHADQTFILSDFQLFWLVNVLGLNYKKTDLRYFRKVVLHIARKSGKTFFIGVFIIYMTIFNCNKGDKNELYSPTKELTADTIFDEIKQLVEQIDPNGEFVRIFKEVVFFPKKHSSVKLKALKSRILGEGLDIPIWLIDEYQHVRTDLLVENLIHGQGIQPEPLGILVFTAGNYGSPAQKLVEEGVEVLNGERENRTFYMMFNLDEGDDWTDPKNLYKANPNLGITTSYENYCEDLEEAKLKPSSQFEFKTKKLNIFVQPSTTWITMKQLEPITIRPDQFDRTMVEKCYCSLDLASTNDMTANGYLYLLTDGKMVFDVEYYLPNQAMMNNPAYQEWSNTGLLTLTNSTYTDYEVIKKHIQNRNNEYPIHGIYYDVFNSSQFINDLETLGFDCTIVAQKTFTQEVAIRLIERLIDTGTLLLIDNPILQWNFRNVKSMSFS